MAPLPPFFGHEPGAALRDREVCRAARAAGMLTVVDCVSAVRGNFGASVAPVLPEVDVAFANDFEAGQVSGVKLGRGATLARGAVEAAGRALVALGVRRWAVVHFPEGV